jgi:glycosyltransferase involved in cell wall biosynthesis
MHNKKKVITICYTLEKGGASIATKDFIKISKNFNPDSFSISATDRPKFGQKLFLWYLWQFLRYFEQIVIRVIFNRHKIKQSLNWFTEPKIKKALINAESNSILHFHWIANSTISIRDLKHIPPGSLITLHDEWLISGASHYKSSNLVSLTTNNYSPFKKLSDLLDKISYKNKVSVLEKRNDLTITVPTKWMKNQLKRSCIFKNANIIILPNGVDTNQFNPNIKVRKTTRNTLNISDQDFVISFGAAQSSRNPVKGLDLFEKLIKLMSQNKKQYSKVVFLVFGGLNTSYLKKFGFRIINLGVVSDIEKLTNLYRSSDVLLHLAKLEAFGLVPCEAMSCGTPVICFDNSGTAEIVLHNKTGKVCSAFNLESVANGLLDMINYNTEETSTLRKLSRERILSEFSLDRLQGRYCELLSSNNLK